jgi:sec-independent protein translocase protein TatB
MNFLGVGPGELLLIFILLLVVVGPERLPGMARTFGRGLVRVRNWMQTSPDAALVLRARQELEAELAEIRSSLLEVQSVRDEVMGVAKQLDEAVSPINTARANLSDLIKEPLDKPLPRTSNGQPATPPETDQAVVPSEHMPPSAEALDMPSIQPPTLGEMAHTTEQQAPEQISSAGQHEPSSAARPVPAAPAPAPDGTAEDVGQRVQHLIDEIRLSKEAARAEAAARSAQNEALMADLHALQLQLKQRGLLEDGWQPPSWTMYLPNEQADMQTKEADG